MFPDPMNPNPFYLVVEIQEADNGTKSCIPWFFDTYEDAVSKFGSVLSAASISTIPYHGVMVLDNNGMVRPGDCRVFDRRNLNG